MSSANDLGSLSWNTNNPSLEQLVELSRTNLVGSGPSLPILKPGDTIDRHLLERAILHSVECNLHHRSHGSWDQHDDDLFAVFTGYVQICLEENCPQPAIQLWECELQERVCNTEQQLVAADRIHKGSPLFNVGLCAFVSGDYAKAMQYIYAAAEEDRLLGRDFNSLIVGSHGLSRQILIDPVSGWLGKCSASLAAYRAVTGKQLNATEFEGLVQAVAFRLEDACHLLGAVHTFVRSEAGPANEMRRHTRTRALGDLALVIESSLRAFQPPQPPNLGHLHARLETLLDDEKVPQFRQSFVAAHHRFCQQFSKNPDKETAVGLKWAVDDALQNLNGSLLQAERIGIAAYLALRVRNSLAHVIDPAVVFYSDEQKLLTVAGYMLGIVRIVQCGRDGTLASL
jgi:hypothetical protein